MGLAMIPKFRKKPTNNKQAIDKDEFDRRLYNKFQGRIECLCYLRMNEMALFRCNVCGYVWEAQAYSTLHQKYGCFKCARKFNGENLVTPFQEYK